LVRAIGKVKFNPGEILAMGLWRSSRTQRLFTISCERPYACIRCLNASYFIMIYNNWPPYIPNIHIEKIKPGTNAEIDENF